MTGLKKHAAANFFDTRWTDFEGALEKGKIRKVEIPAYFTYSGKCVDCDDPVIRIKYRGRSIDAHIVNGVWVLHQCPYPEHDLWPDDPCVRDGDGEIRGGGWHDDKGDDQDRRQFEDPKYRFDYPDIPYVDPTQGSRKR